MNGPRLLEKNGVLVDDAPVIVRNSNIISKGSLPIKRFSWEDAQDLVKIRIDNLPKKGSIVHDTSWGSENIPKDNIDACLINNNRGVLVQIKCNDTTSYHLRINRLYGIVTEVKTIRKNKRLIIKIAKKNQREWPSLETTTPDVDESEFLSDVPNSKDPTNFLSK